MKGLIEKMKKVLPEARFTHVMAVVEEARFLADELGCSSVDTLIRAAILHDCTKPLSYAEHISLAEKYSYTLTENDVRSPEVLHSVTGALAASHEFGESEEVATLIFYHTTGKANMSLFEKILFISDYTEKTRRHESCLAEREHLHNGLKKARSNEERMKLLDISALRILENTISYLKKKNVFIHPDTICAIDFLKSQGES